MTSAQQTQVVERRLKGIEPAEVPLHWWQRVIIRLSWCPGGHGLLHHWHSNGSRTLTVEVRQGSHACDRHTVTRTRWIWRDCCACHRGYWGRCIEY